MRDCRRSVFSLPDKGTNIKRQDHIEILQKTNRRTMASHMRRSAFSQADRAD